jgi:hypothetical protein
VTPAKPVVPDVSYDRSANSNPKLDWLSDEILFSKALWSGFYSGLYSVNKKGMVPKPTEDCLG